MGSDMKISLREGEVLIPWGEIEGEDEHAEHGHLVGGELVATGSKFRPYRRASRSEDRSSVAGIVKGVAASGAILALYPDEVRFGARK